MPHGIREVVLDHQDPAVASGNRAPDDAPALLDGHFHAHRAGRGKPGLDVVQGHGAGAAQLAGDGPVAVRVHERVTAEVGRQGIPAAGPDQLQALALRHPAHPGLADLLCSVHPQTVPQGHLEGDPEGDLTARPRCPAGCLGCGAFGGGDGHDSAGERRGGDPAVPGGPAADLVLVQPRKAFAGQEFSLMAHRSPVILTSAAKEIGCGVAAVER